MMVNSLNFDFDGISCFLLQGNIKIKLLTGKSSSKNKINSYLHH